MKQTNICRLSGDIKNDGIKWRDCSHMLNCCLSFGEMVKANVLILIKVICTSRSNAMNTRNIFTTEHRCVTSQAIVVQMFPTSDVITR